MLTPPLDLMLDHQAKQGVRRFQIASMVAQLGENLKPAPFIICQQTAKLATVRSSANV
jgi:hypothetical protein